MELGEKFEKGQMSDDGRLAFLRMVEEWKALDADQKTQKNAHLLVVGVNKLAMFNEAFGRNFTNDFLEHVGEDIASIVGHMGNVARIDGNVFGVFVYQEYHDDIGALAKYILDYFHDAPIRTEYGRMAVPLSIGGLSLTGEEDSLKPHELLDQAEMAMRAAKEKRYSCFVSYHEVSHQAKDYRGVLEKGDLFLQALKQNRLKLAYQPIMPSTSENTTFYECLIRMLGTEGNVFQAGSFIGDVEALGLSHLADQYAMRTALQELIQYPELGLSVNVSHMSLHSREWLGSLTAVLRTRPDVAQRLVIELTESAAMGDPENTVRVVKALQDLGCRVALDDFGAGYTAFSQIRDLNVDFIKIDKSYIRNIHDEKNQLFIDTLRSLAEGLGAATIGEGAENLTEVKILSDGGISYIQGYAFGKPKIERVWLLDGDPRRKIIVDPLDDVF